MVKSYKMMTLLAMLNADVFPGEMGIDDLVKGFARLAGRSARLRKDVSVSLDDHQALKRLIEENPIQAWIGGRGTGGVQYFQYENGVFRFALDVPEMGKEEFQELTRELVDWRLAEYLSRTGNDQQTQIVCKVSHSNGKPILFLPDREKQPDIPEGWQDVLIDGEFYEANFVKVAVNVVRLKGETENVLAEILWKWFGSDAGLPGTSHRVSFILDDGVYHLEPMGKKKLKEAELWQAYHRPEIPSFFGLEFNTGAWNQGYVFQGNQIFLFVTLNKDSLHSDFQYQDRFLNQSLFQWQSQNSTTHDSTTGQRLFRHQEKNIPVHLFVREVKIRGGKAAPFIYCGEVDFVSGVGDRPITIHWHLQTPVPESLWKRLKVPSDLL